MRTALLAGLVTATALALAVPALAAPPADAANGRAIFSRTCANCHETKVGLNKVGPTLYNIVGRKVAVVPGFAYSEALKGREGEWDEPELDAYLSNPRGTIHGVNMYFKGLSSPKDRADVIAYLKTLK